MSTRGAHNHSRLTIQRRAATCQSKRVPAALAQYFWDCDCSKIHITTHAAFITERILQYGNPQAVRWLLTHVPRCVITDVILHNRRLDAKTRNYWRLMGYGA